MVVPLLFLALARAVLIASPTRVPTVLGLTMSSLRSTFVRCCPSGAPERPAYRHDGSTIKFLGLCLYMRQWGAGENEEGLTTLPVVNFFSVPTTAPERCAAFKAAAPRTTVSRCDAPAPRVRLPILVTVSQSSDMVAMDAVLALTAWVYAVSATLLLQIRRRLALCPGCLDWSMDVW